MVETTLKKFYFPDYAIKLVKEVEAETEEAAIVAARQRGLSVELVQPGWIPEGGWPELEGGEKKVRRYGEEREEHFEGMDTTMPTEAEEKKIREDTATRMQSYIDAINLRYAQLMGGEEKRGEERLGMTRAMMARGGLMGAPMGAAQMEKTKGFTQEQIRLLGQERELKKEAILTRIDERATEEIRLKRKETKEDIRLPRTIRHPWFRCWSRLWSVC